MQLGHKIWVSLHLRFFFLLVDIDVHRSDTDNAAQLFVVSVTEISLNRRNIPAASVFLSMSSVCYNPTQFLQLTINVSVYSFV